MNFSSRTAVGAKTLDLALQGYQFSAAFLFVVASMTLLAAALADAFWHARAVSEMVGWPGLILLVVSLVYLFHSGAIDDRHSKHTNLFGGSAIVGHPMRDRLLDG
jgi:hypothetical protein